MGAIRIWAVGAALISGNRRPRGHPPAKSEEDSVSVDDVLEAGKNLFDELAPDEVKAQFEFPDKARWDATVRQLQAALDGTDPKALLQFEPEVRSVLSMLRNLPGGGEYADWLAERLDYIEAAKQLPSAPPKPPVVRPSTQFIPQYDLWVTRTRQRAKPSQPPMHWCPGSNPCLWPAGCLAIWSGWRRSNRASIRTPVARSGRADCSSSCPTRRGNLA